MGFGIAAGFVLFMLVVVLAVAFLFAIVAGGLTWPFAPRGSLFAGTGPATSSSMRLAGTYTVEWTAQPTSPSACHIDAGLFSSGSSSVYIPLVYTPVDGNLDPGPIRAIEVPARDDYFIRVDSGCAWSIRLVNE